ncbi:unnamed protein product [Withania somnifera]
METPSQDFKNKGDDVQEKPKVENEGGDEKERVVETETPSQDIKNKEDDTQEKPKVENEEGGEQKEKIVEKETPPQDIKNKGEDAQEKPKVEHVEEKGAKVRRVPVPGGSMPAQKPGPPGKHAPPHMQTG